MAAATPALRPPTAVRVGDAPPRDRRAPTSGGARRGRGRGDGRHARRRPWPTASVAVVAPDSMVDEVSRALDAAGIDARAGDADRARQAGHRRAGQRRRRASSSTASSWSSRRRSSSRERRACARCTSRSPAPPSASRSSTPRRCRHPSRRVCEQRRAACRRRGTAAGRGAARWRAAGAHRAVGRQRHRAGGGAAGGRHAAHPHAGRAAPDRVVPQRARAGTGLRRR